jgi:hypothetical protein
MIALMIAGCDSSDERLADYAQQTAAQQAQQNAATADVARKAAENQRRVIETVEKSRQDLIGVQKELDLQRTTIAQEHKELTEQRRQESLLAPVLTTIGYLLVTALPLGLCWYLLHTLKSSPVDESAVTQLLVQDLLSEQPVLLPRPVNSNPRLVHESGSRLAIEDHQSPDKEESTS